jgi:hypothetical protein
MQCKFFSLAPAGLGLIGWLIGGTIINAQESLFIEINGDTVTADVDRVPLEEVIDALNEQTSATISISGTVLSRPEATVSATFENLPLRNGINQLLKGHGHLLNFNKQTQQPGTINIRLIAAAPPVARPVPGSNTQTAANDDLLERLRTLADEEDIAGLTAALAEAVNDTNMPVRLEALRIFDTLDEEDLPMDQVQQMALSDPEPALRLQALEVIGKQNNERAKEALTQIAQGGDEVTSGRAGELLEKLNQTQ